VLRGVSRLSLLYGPELWLLAGSKSRSSAESESESYCIDKKDAMVLGFQWGRSGG